MKKIKNMTEKQKTIFTFRKYTRLGLANSRLCPFDVYDIIRGVSKTKSDALDLLAVYDTLRILTALGTGDYSAYTNSELRLLRLSPSERSLSPKTMSRMIPLTQNAHRRKIYKDNIG